MGEPVDVIKKNIETLKEVFIILDHTRTILITVSDGCLPSNVGGGSNVRNILRRCFFLLKKNGWWEKIGMDGFIEIFEHHKKDLEGVFGAFKEYKSFGDIMKVEYQRWCTTDSKQAADLQALLKKKKNKLVMEDWIMIMTSWGISADKISEISKLPIPGNLYYEIALK